MTMTREHWLGFLMGALDEDEQALVQRQLAANPQAAEELDQLRSHLLLLSDGLDEAAPPPGLATRTCALLDSSAAPAQHPAILAQMVETAAPTDDNAPRPKSQISRSQGSRSQGRLESLGMGGTRFSLMDTLVAVGVCVAVAIIFFPALANSRMLATRLQCENNLRRVGVALQEFATVNKQHRYPAIAPQGPLSVAGAFAPRLLNDGFLHYPEIVQCAERRGKAPARSLPTVQQLMNSPVNEVAQLHEKLLAVYNYNLGIQKNGAIVAPQMQGRALYPVASDNLLVQEGKLAPVAHEDGRFNILFDDGHVEFIALEDLPGPMKHFFLNDEGNVAAGLSEDDPVIAIGTAHPLAVNEQAATP